MTPTNARRAPHADIERDWDRFDPLYDEPRPLDWRELADLRLWIGAILWLIALGAFCVLLFTIVPAPR